MDKARKRIGFGFAVILLLWLAPWPLTADENESPGLKRLLLMPGKLTQSHAHLENQCKQCHLHFDTSGQASLCLDCHKTIRQDTESKLGYHGRLAPAKLERCADCHSDHLGRDADIKVFDIDRFDHSQTDFTLKGAHKNQVCGNCHDKTNPKSKKPTFLLPDSQCSSCHQDPHQGRLSTNCSDCHNQQRWQVTTFDHDKTDFPLKDKHSEVACRSCHVKEVSAPVGNQCSNCHNAVDNHLGVFGERCDSCHTPAGWTDTSYDHKAKTQYALTGKHGKLECSACHFEQLNPQKSCSGCHRQNDIHLGGNGNNCNQCHSTDKWSKAKFDHNKDTRFAIDGAHQQLACTACHLPGQKPKSTKRVRQCNDCHQANDPHKQALGKQCQDCHNSSAWDKDIAFTHDLTKFPLTGSHGLLPCSACHQNKTFQIDNQTCNGCHEKDDVHNNTLGEQCVQCHNVSSWSAWQFNHQKQTSYPLVGAHQNLSCELCHTQELSQPTQPPKTCGSCHKADDAHNGTFGSNCGQCHNKEHFYETSR